MLVKSLTISESELQAKAI